MHQGKKLRIFQAVVANRDLFRIVPKEAPGLDSEIDAIPARINGVMLRRMETELVIGRRTGIIGPADSKLAAQMVLGPILVVIVNHLLESRPPDVEAPSEKVTEVQYYGTHGKPEGL